MQSPSAATNPNSQTAVTLPPINDQMFDRRMALAVFDQNERRIKADEAVAETNRGVMQAIIGVQTADVTITPPSRRAEALALICTMTSAQRAKPAQAVAAAVAILDALDAAGLR